MEGDFSKHFEIQARHNFQNYWLDIMVKNYD